MPMLISNATPKEQMGPALYSQTEMLEQAILLGHKCLFAVKDSDSKNRTYGSFTDWTVALQSRDLIATKKKTGQKIPDYGQRLYEVIVENNPDRLYLDLETKIDEKPKNLDHITFRVYSYVVKSTIKNLENLYPILCEGKRLKSRDFYCWTHHRYIQNKDGNKNIFKLSWRFVIVPKHFELLVTSNSQIKRIVQEINNDPYFIRKLDKFNHSDIEKGTPFRLDTTVYSKFQTLRLFDSYKDDINEGYPKFYKDESPNLFNYLVTHVRENVRIIELPSLDFPQINQIKYQGDKPFKEQNVAEPVHDRDIIRRLCNKEIKKLDPNVIEDVNHGRICDDVIYYKRINRGKCIVTGRMHDNQGFRVHVDVYGRFRAYCWSGHCEFTEENKRAFKLLTCKLDDEDHFKLESYKFSHKWTLPFSSKEKPFENYIKVDNTDHVVKILDWMNDPNIKILIVQSNTGTGKTELVRAIVLHKNKEYKRILLVICRRTFAKDVHGKLEKDEFECYIDGDPHNNRVIDSIDSLEKLLDENNEIEPFDLVILDEIESLLSYFQTADYLKNATKLFDLFTCILKMSKKIIALDAFISNMSYDFLKALDPNIIAIQNTYRNSEPKIYRIIVDKNEWLNDMICNLKKGRNIAIATCSSEEGEKTEEKLLAEFPNIIIANYNKMSKDSHLKELDNVNENWSKYNVVIYTPIVQMGVDYSKTKHIYKIYGFVCDKSTDYKGFCQMLPRVRFPEINEYLICLDPAISTSITAPLYNVNMIRNYLIAHKNKFMICIDDDAKQIMDNIVKKYREDYSFVIQANGKTKKETNDKLTLFDDIFCHAYTTRLNSRKENFLTALKTLIEKENLGVFIPPKERTGEQFMKNGKSYNLEAFLTAPIITTKEFNKLESDKRNNIGISDTNKWSIQKYLYCKTFGINPLRNVVLFNEFVEIYKPHKIYLISWFMYLLDARNIIVTADKKPEIKTTDQRATGPGNLRMKAIEVIKCFTPDGLKGLFDKDFKCSKFPREDLLKTALFKKRKETVMEMGGDVRNLSKPEDLENDRLLSCVNDLLGKFSINIKSAKPKRIKKNGKEIRIYSYILNNTFNEIPELLYNKKNLGYKFYDGENLLEMYPRTSIWTDLYLLIEECINP